MRAKKERILSVPFFCKKLLKTAIQCEKHLKNTLVHDMINLMKTGELSIVFHIWLQSV